MRGPKAPLVTAIEKLNLREGLRQVGSRSFREICSNMAGQVDVAVLEKENFTPSGHKTAAVKRPAEWEAEKGEQQKKKGGLRPSTRVTNIPNVTKDASKPVKPTIMGPPPPRAPPRTDDGATAGPSRTLLKVNNPEGR